MIVIVVVVVTTAAAVVAGGRWGVFEAWEEGLRSAGDANEREESAFNTIGRRTHLEDDVVRSQGDVEFRAVFEAALQNDALIAKREHGIHG